MWNERNRQGVAYIVRQRGWRDEDITVLISDEHQIIHKARSVMFPGYNGHKEELGDGWSRMNNKKWEGRSIGKGYGSTPRKKPCSKVDVTWNT
jgi:hypothetical protein